MGWKLYTQLLESKIPSKRLYVDKTLLVDNDHDGLGPASLVYRSADLVISRSHCLSLPLRL